MGNKRALIQTGRGLSAVHFIVLDLTDNKESLLNIESMVAIGVMHKNSLHLYVLTGKPYQKHDIQIITSNQT